MKVLLILFAVYGASEFKITTIEFNSMESCWTALGQINNVDIPVLTNGVCVEDMRK